MKLFTLAEANELLPELRQIFLRIKTARKQLARHATAAKRAAAHATANGGSANGTIYAQAILDLMNGMDTIAELGVEVKDIERGLCDFPALRDGRVVYLCWLLGEEKIEWWHDLETGFAGRQPL